MCVFHSCSMQLLDEESVEMQISSSTAVTGALVEHLQGLGPDGESGTHVSQSPCWEVWSMQIH